MRGTCKQRTGCQNRWCAQVDENGGDALAAVLGARVDGVVEEVVMRLVLLAVLVVQDLQRATGRIAAGFG